MKDVAHGYASTGGSEPIGRVILTYSVLRTELKTEQRKLPLASRSNFVDAGVQCLDGDPLEEGLTLLKHCWLRGRTWFEENAPFTLGAKGRSRERR